MLQKAFAETTTNRTANTGKQESNTLQNRSHIILIEDYTKHVFSVRPQSAMTNSAPEHFTVTGIEFK